MADLLVKRAMARRDLLRRYVIEVDGEPAGHVRAGGTAHVRIATGIRTVRLTIDGYGCPAQTILAADHGLAIVQCAPAELPVLAERRPGAYFRQPYLPADRTAWLTAEIEAGDELARRFLRGAWSLARYRLAERARPGTRTPYGLTVGELAVLYHGCRTADARVATARGSANHRLWRELARIGWLAEAQSPIQGAAGPVAYGLTDPGRIELLDIFA